MTTKPKVLKNLKRSWNKSWKLKSSKEYEPCIEQLLIFITYSWVHLCLFVDIRYWYDLIESNFNFPCPKYSLLKFGIQLPCMYACILMLPFSLLPNKVSVQKLECGLNVQ